MPPVSTLRPDALLCFNLYAASHAFTRYYKPLLDPLGLTYPQFLVMLSLAQQDGQGVGRLSEDLSLDTNTLSPLLKRLESAGLVSRRRSDADERKVFVHLTDAGRAVAERAQQVPGCMAETLGLTLEHVTAHSAALRELRTLLAGEALPVAHPT